MFIKYNSILKVWIFTLIIIYAIFKLKLSEISIELILIFSGYILINLLFIVLLNLNKYNKFIYLYITIESIINISLFLNQVFLFYMILVNFDYSKLKYQLTLLLINFVYLVYNSFNWYLLFKTLMKI